MPNKDERAKAVVTGGKHKTAGRMVVTYRDANGYTQNATVAAAGGASGLKLALTSEDGRIIDNIAACATMKSTNCYISRL